MHGLPQWLQARGSSPRSPMYWQARAGSTDRGGTLCLPLALASSASAPPRRAIRPCTPGLRRCAACGPGPRPSGVGNDPAPGSSSRRASSSGVHPGGQLHGGRFSAALMWCSSIYAIRRNPARRSRHYRAIFPIAFRRRPYPQRRLRRQAGAGPWRGVPRQGPTPSRRSAVPASGYEVCQHDDYHQRGGYRGDGPVSGAYFSRQDHDLSKLEHCVCLTWRSTAPTTHERSKRTVRAGLRAPPGRRWRRCDQGRLNRASSPIRRP